MIFLRGGGEVLGKEMKDCHGKMELFRRVSEGLVSDETLTGGFGHRRWDRPAYYYGKWRFID